MINDCFDSELYENSTHHGRDLVKLKVFRDGWFEADSLHTIAAVDDG